MYDFTFDGTEASSLGFHAEIRPDIPIPEVRQDIIIVPGRDGIITRRDGSIGAMDIKIPISFTASSRDTFNAKVRTLKSWILGKYNKELQLGDDIEHYYKVNYVWARGDVARKNGGKIGTVTLNFNCDGYTYLEEGKFEYPLNEIKENPYCVCHPNYIITTSTLGNTCTITVNSKEFKVVVGSSPIYVDTDRMLTLENRTVVANEIANGNYQDLWLQPGTNRIYVTNGFTLTAIPHWRKL